MMIVGLGKEGVKGVEMLLYLTKQSSTQKPYGIAAPESTRINSFSQSTRLTLVFITADRIIQS